MFDPKTTQDPYDEESWKAEGESQVVYDRYEDKDC